MQKLKNIPKGHSLHSAFTIIELMFVIVVLGILSAIALPKFSETKNLADISKGRSDVMSLRSSIITARQSQLIKGNSNFIPKLSDNGTTLFTGDGNQSLLLYGVTAGVTDGHWSATDNSYKNYAFHVHGVSIPFAYDSATGKFTCNANKDGTTAQKYCYQMTK